MTTLLALLGSAVQAGDVRELLGAAAAKLGDAASLSFELTVTLQEKKIGTGIVHVKAPNLIRMEAREDGTLKQILVLDGANVWHYRMETKRYLKEPQREEAVRFIAMSAPIVALYLWGKDAPGRLLEGAKDISVEKKKIGTDERDVVSWKTARGKLSLALGTDRWIKEWSVETDRGGGEAAARQSYVVSKLELSLKGAKDLFTFVPPADAQEEKPGGGGEFEESLLAVGSVAPDFEATRLDGCALKLSSFKGKPVLINFWFYS